MSDEHSSLQAAARIIFAKCGGAGAPFDPEAGANALRSALAAGALVPRMRDKTALPMGISPTEKAMDRRG